MPISKNDGGKYLRYNTLPTGLTPVEDSVAFTYDQLIPPPQSTEATTVPVSYTSDTDPIVDLDCYLLDYIAFIESQENLK